LHILLLVVAVSIYWFNNPFIPSQARHTGLLSRTPLLTLEPALSVVRWSQLLFRVDVVILTPTFYYFCGRTFSVLFVLVYLETQIMYFNFTDINIDDDDQGISSESYR